MSNVKEKKQSKIISVVYHTVVELCDVKLSEPPPKPKLTSV